MEKNSFYDVNQRYYSKEELDLYRDLTGMPLYGSYDEMMYALNRKIKNNVSSREKKTKNKQNIKRSNHKTTSN